MDERELVLTSLVYPLIFREATQIGIATPVAAHIRELLKIQTPEPEVIKLGNASPVSALIRNIFQNYEHPLQDFAQIGVAKPVGAYFKNLFNEYIHPHSDFTQIGNATPVSMYSKNMLQNLQTFKTDHVVQVSNAIPEAVYSTCKPVVFAPVNLRGGYDGGSIQLFWSNSSITHSHQNLYRSTTPFTESNLPPVYQYIFRGVNSYIDEDVVEGITYYYAVSTEAGLVQLVSDVTEVVTVEISNCDLHWDKVVALLHFDQSYADEKGGEWSVTGSPIFVDGRFSQGLETTIATPVHRVESPAGIYFGTDDFAIELFAKRTDVTKRGTIFDFRDSTSTNNPLPLLDMNRDGSIGLRISGIYRVRTPQNTLTTSFKHIALTKNNGNFRLFVDGILLGSYFSDEALPISTLKLSYNMRADVGNWAFVGVYDELRITKGVARYTENFTPPTEPFPNFGCS